MPRTPTSAEDELRAALHASKLLNGDQMNTARSPERDTEAKLPRVVIDMKVPLPVILSAALFLAGGGISMFFKVNAMAEAVNDMKTTMTANASTQAQLIVELTNTKSDLGLIRYRLDKLEAVAPGARK